MDNTFKTHYYAVIGNLNGCEYLRIGAERAIAKIERMAPSSRDDKRRYYENERAKLVGSSNHPLTDTFVLSGFALNDAFFAEAERLSRLNLDEFSDGRLRAWHWGTAYIIGVICYNLELLSDDIPAWDGIAAVLAKYITGASDRTLTYIITKHCLPSGTEKATWTGKTQDAGRFAKIVHLKPAEFNACFAGRKIDSNTFKPGKLADGEREHELYFIIEKYATK